MTQMPIQPITHVNPHQTKLPNEVPTPNQAMQMSNLFQKGPRINLRAKVNSSLITGIRVVDSILPVGRGQRQLIIGDRYTGKTTIFFSLLLISNSYNPINTIDGFGTQRLFGIYIGINQNLSKLNKLILLILNHYLDYYILILASHSSSPSLFSFLIPILGITINEYLRDRGYDCCCCFDDLSKHAKSFRQLSLLIGKIPSRDAFPADIFNIHSSILERSGKLRYNYYNGSISCLPIIETINSNISEYISTNVISITDGQIYLSKTLFLDSLRPAVDSGLSVSRLGSNVQCKLMKVVASGIKNELTNYRITINNLSPILYLKLLSLNMIFYQDYLFSSPIETTILILLSFKLGYLYSNFQTILKYLYLLTSPVMYLYYLVFLNKYNYSHNLYQLLSTYILQTVQYL